MQSEAINTTTSLLSVYVEESSSYILFYLPCLMNDLVTITPHFI